LHLRHLTGNGPQVLQPLAVCRESAKLAFANRTASVCRGSPRSAAGLKQRRNGSHNVTMQSPWLQIPLSEYEAHMALPDVAPAPLLASQFEALLRDALQLVPPEDVAIAATQAGFAPLSSRRIALRSSKRFMLQTFRFSQESSS
jgi:hypothetical protein